MSSLNQYLPPLSTAMPAFTGLLTLVGLGAGLYTFTSPAAAPSLFGIIPLSSVMPKDVATTNSPPSPSWAALRAYIRVHGIRNFSNGLAGVGLSLYALFGAGSAAEAAIVRKCLGVMMLAGAPVALGDGWLIGEYVKALKESGDEAEDGREVKEAIKVGEEKSTGHMFTSAFIVAVGVGCLMS